MRLPDFGLVPELEAGMAEHHAANGRRLRDALLSRGAVVDPIAALRAITRREPSVRPLLERRGLAGGSGHLRR